MAIGPMPAINAARTTAVAARRFPRDCMLFLPSPKWLFFEFVRDHAFVGAIGNGLDAHIHAFAARTCIICIRPRALSTARQYRARSKSLGFCEISKTGRTAPRHSFNASPARGRFRWQPRREAAPEENHGALPRAYLPLRVSR